MLWVTLCYGSATDTVLHAARAEDRACLHVNILYIFHDTWFVKLYVFIYIAFVIKQKYKRGQVVSLDTYFSRIEQMNEGI